MNFPDAVRNVLTNYANFKGRARRSEYWWWFLAAFGIMVSASIIDGIAGSYPVIYVLAGLAIFLPNLAVSIRRLHDTGRSGWWILIGFVPLVGFIVLIVFYTQDSHADNQYGPSPKAQFGGGQPQAYGTQPPAYGG